MNAIQEAIGQIIAGGDLSREAAAAAMGFIMSGEATSSQIGGLLVALRMKGETVDEITGFAETMRGFAARVTTARQPLVDTCGTGGDASGTFNISTTAAFVVAGAEVAVAKHGNRSASSKCGSADVLETLGVCIDATPERIGACIDEAGIGFLFARNLHSAMKHVAGARQELKTRTVFNILGPLTNPAGATAQAMGIFDPALVEPIARVLSNLGCAHALVFHGADGLDELSISGPSTVAEARNGTVRLYELLPETAGLTPAPLEALQGGEAKENAAILRSVLEGEPGPRRDVVLLNAAAALIAADQADDWKEAVGLAAKSIDTGAAADKLELLVKVSNDS